MADNNTGEAPHPAEKAQDALRRLLWELPAEFGAPPDADHDRRDEFRVIKRRNVRAVHVALWDLQVALGVAPPAGEDR